MNHHQTHNSTGQYVLLRSFRFRLNESLALCYERIKNLLTAEGMGFPPEPFSVVSAVDEHRRHWKPRQVRTLLLAESHVYTESGLMLNYDEFPALKSLPKTYVRLVYCLGYGEGKLVEGSISHNRGTPQFWKILSKCPGIPNDKVLKKSEPNDTSRIQNKIKVLGKLEESAVWLQDASIVALYRKGVKPPIELTERIISECWRHYILPQIRMEKPRRVIVIGEHVHQILTRQPHNDVKMDWIKQPQGCRVPGEFNEELARLGTLLSSC